MGSTNDIDKLFGGASGQGIRANQAAFAQVHVLYHTVESHLQTQILTLSLKFFQPFGRHQRQSYMLQDIKDKPTKYTKSINILFSVLHNKNIAYLLREPTLWYSQFIAARKTWYSESTRRSSEAKRLKIVSLGRSKNSSSTLTCTKLVQTYLPRRNRQINFTKKVFFWVGFLQALL